MTLKEVKKALMADGQLDERQLISYATLSGNIFGSSFQNLVAVIFEKEQLSIYHAKTDGSVGNLFTAVAYQNIENLTLKHRFLYSYTEFSSQESNFRFYSYDKNVFLKGFSDAELFPDKK